MPHRKLPQTTPEVSYTLRTARTMWNNTSDPALRAIPADLWARLSDTDANSIASRFLKEAGELDAATAGQGNATVDLDTVRSDLSMHISHFHQVFDMGVARKLFKAPSRAYYGRDINDTAIPPLGTDEEIQIAAEKAIKGEADRKAAEGGAYVEMNMPNISRIVTLLNSFKTARSAALQSRVKMNKEQEDASTLLPEARNLAIDICDTVEFYYRKDPDPASRRQKCALWGVVYVYDEGETPPAPAPSPTPTPPAG